MDKHVKERFVLSVALSICALLTSVYPGPAHAQDLDNSVWPTNQWLTSTPEEQGMDSSALAKLVAFGESHSFDSLSRCASWANCPRGPLRSLHGDVPHEIFSSTKAITGTLLGNGLQGRPARPSRSSHT